jgi:hypothetical protein
MTVEPFWAQINETVLRQGDHLARCLVPVFGSDLAATGTHDVTADEYDLIVVTQSCDLEQRKIRLVAVCLEVVRESALAPSRAEHSPPV